MGESEGEKLVYRGTMTIWGSSVIMAPEILGGGDVMDEKRRHRSACSSPECQDG